MLWSKKPDPRKIATNTPQMGSSLDLTWDVASKIYACGKLSIEDEVA